MTYCTDTWGATGQLKCGDETEGREPETTLSGFHH